MESTTVRAQSSAGRPLTGARVERAGSLLGRGAVAGSAWARPGRSAPKECTGFVVRSSVRMDSKRLGIRARITRVAVCALCTAALLAAAPERATAASTLVSTDAVPAQRFSASPQQEMFLDQLQ